jgi:hypothetical protein
MLRLLVVPNLRHQLILGSDFITLAGGRISFGDAPLSVRSVSVVDAPPLVPIDLRILNQQYTNDVRALAAEFSTIFAGDDDAFGDARVEPLRFEVGNENSPIHSHPYRLSGPENDFLETTVALWLEHGRIRPSNSPWAAPAHVVEKDGGKGLRLVINFRKLNERIQPDNQPMPRAQDIFDSLHGRRIFSKLDFQAAYLQIPVAEECRRFLSFVTRSGQYEFNNVPFGLNIAFD